MPPLLSDRSTAQPPSAPPTPLFFYHYLGAHSLLIGLLPFFLAVFLWQLGVDLANLCFMMGASGLAFVGVLSVWQRLFRSGSLNLLIWLTFSLELLLIVTLGYFTLVPGEALHQSSLASDDGLSFSPMFACLTIGLANGAYNAFFWTTQRSLFLQLLGGKRYGETIW